MKRVVLTVEELVALDTSAKLLTRLRELGIDPTQDYDIKFDGNDYVCTGKPI